MKSIKKTELIFEYERSITFTLGSDSILIHCPVCNETVQFLTVDEASIIKQIKAREIFRLIEEGRIHFFENDVNLLLVCFASLNELFVKNLSADKKIK